MSNLLVSIIVACHNASAFIDECLESLVNQTYRNIEIIVCDDASSDSSWSILQKWKKKDKRVLLLRNDGNRGAGYTRNRCLKIASGDFHMIQDIDDYSSLDRVEILLNCLLKEPTVSFVSSMMHAFDENGIHVDIKFKGKMKEYPTKWDFLWVLPFSHATTMFRREVLHSIDGYLSSPIVDRQEDYEMMMRAYAKGYRGKNIFNVLYFYRYNTTSIQRIQNQSLLNYIRIRYAGFKAMGLMPWGFPFVFKPFLSHFYHLFQINGFKRRHSSEDVA